MWEAAKVGRYMAWNNGAHWPLRCSIANDAPQLAGPHDALFTELSAATKVRKHFHVRAIQKGVSRSFADDND